MDKTSEVAKKVISKDFVVDLAKYFMTFLETDFKKRRQPKRNLSSRMNKGLSVGLYLDKYSSLSRQLHKNFVAGFAKEQFPVQQKQFTTNLPQSLTGLLKHSIDKLSEIDLGELIDTITEAVDKIRVSNQGQYSDYLEESVSEIKQNITSKIVAPLITDIKHPLQNAGLSTEAGLYQLEVDAVDKIFHVVEDSLGEVLEKYYAGSQESGVLKEYLRTQLSRDTVTKLLKDFFHEFSIADAYSDIYQLHRNKEMLDKTELYFYFCELSIETFSFPIFYSPVTTIHSGTEIKLIMDTRIFVNTKAIEYVIQEFNQQAGTKDSLGNKLDRILYIDNKKELLDKLQGIINNIASILDVEAVNLEDSSNQSKSVLNVKMNNRLQLFLFDKSDEALINDYEEIIDDEGGLADSFSDLINVFISENPKKFIEEVADDWINKKTSEKLVVQSPIPLNEEQKQAMLALDKDDCNIAILEGPPGTGKSHTITAIVCKALLDGQSVLILSDKDEALDVVQDKITEALNKVRHDKNFQNPILRLGKTGGSLAKVIGGQSLERVREHYRAYKTKKDDAEKLINKSKAEAMDEIDRVILTAGDINLEEVVAIEKQAYKYEPLKWATQENIEELANPLRELHKAVCHINNSQGQHLLYVANNADLVNTEIYLKALKTYTTAKELVGKASLEFINRYKNLDGAHKTRIQKKLKKIDSSASDILANLGSSSYLFSKNVSDSELFKSFAERRKNLYLLNKLVHSSKEYLGPSATKSNQLLNELPTYNNSSLDDVIPALQSYVDTVDALTSKLFGLRRKSKDLEQASNNLKKKLPYFKISSPEKKLQDIETTIDYLKFLGQEIHKLGLDQDLWSDVIRLLTSTEANRKALEDSLRVLSTDDEPALAGYGPKDVPQLIDSVNFLKRARELIKIANDNSTINSIIKLTNTKLILNGLSKHKDALEKLNKDYQELADLKQSQTVIVNFSAQYEDAASELGIKPTAFKVSSIDKTFKDMSTDNLNQYIGFLDKNRKYQKLFDQLSKDEYASSIKELEELTTAKMAYLLDTRIIEYVDKNSSDIMTLKSLLKSKQKFPKTLFGGLKQAFPCILAGIRDYATYIPLEKDLFDLVIIDEASQVSIAQSLPAFIRGKKILVLGDDKQFSNVKAGNASKLTNDQFRTQLLSSLKNNIEDINKDLTQQFVKKAEDNFDIKNSVLEFCRSISNYDIMLKKHFRCYPEVISYSNENFYDGELQCMKARALPIREVIKFDYVEQDDKQDTLYNTNTLEVNFITQQISGLKERGYEGTLGVITPHREQASLIHTTLITSDLADWLDKRKLKVMTFDTCQGEERDYIFYSMVATKENDKHRYVFPQTLQKDSFENESNVRRQRLNVGFSRAKETIHFVLSRPIEDYWGEVKNALSFYKRKLDENNEIVVGGTDPNSAMEKKVQDYFYETDFYKKAEMDKKPELKPQFPLGDYLRSLDRTYQHPSYKVDFLMVFEDQKVVIEYDGFREHFIDAEDATKDTIMSYLKEEDVYRQKVLEGYGYKFIRLNKFNLANNPVGNFNDLLVDIVKKKTRPKNHLLMNT